MPVHPIPAGDGSGARAPPFKRQRLQAGAEAQLPLPAPVPDVACGLDVADESDDFLDALPNDVMAALLLIAGQFPKQSKVRNAVRRLYLPAAAPVAPPAASAAGAAAARQPAAPCCAAQVPVLPFALKTQLYNILSDRTAVDRQLDEMRWVLAGLIVHTEQCWARTAAAAGAAADGSPTHPKQCKADDHSPSVHPCHPGRLLNSVRVFQLPGGGNEVAIVPTAAYTAALRALPGAAPSPAPPAPAERRAGSSGSPSAAEVVAWFIGSVLPACCEAAITHRALAALLPSGSSNGCVRFKEANSASSCA